MWKNQNAVLHKSKSYINCFFSFFLFTEHETSNITKPVSGIVQENMRLDSIPNTAGGLRGWNITEDQQ